MVENVYMCPLTHMCRAPLASKPGNGIVKSQDFPHFFEVILSIDTPTVSVQEVSLLHIPALSQGTSSRFLPILYILMSFQFICFWWFKRIAIFSYVYRCFVSFFGTRDFAIFLVGCIFLIHLFKACLDAMLNRTKWSPPTFWAWTSINVTLECSPCIWHLLYTDLNVGKQQQQ